MLMRAADLCDGDRCRKLDGTRYSDTRKHLLFGGSLAFRNSVGRRVAPLTRLTRLPTKSFCTPSFLPLPFGAGLLETRWTARDGVHSSATLGARCAPSACRHAKFRVASSCSTEPTSLSAEEMTGYRRASAEAGAEPKTSTKHPNAGKSSPDVDGLIAIVGVPVFV